jgi:hypothetical protein
MRNVTEKTLRVLNSALEADREAVTKIFDSHFETKYSRWDDAEEDIILGPEETIGPLGLINGICRKQIVAFYNKKTGLIQRFIEWDPAYGALTEPVKKASAS